MVVPTDKLTGCLTEPWQNLKVEILRNGIPKPSGLEPSAGREALLEKLRHPRGEWHLIAARGFAVLPWEDALLKRVELSLLGGFVADKSNAVAGSNSCAALLVPSREV